MPFPGSNLNFMFKTIEWFAGLKKRISAGPSVEVNASVNVCDST